MKSFLNSFKYAGNGILKVIRKERSFRIELSVFVLTVIMGFVFKINIFEWFTMLIFSCIVLLLEMLNTAIESFIDLKIDSYDVHVSHVKDIMAGAVLISSIFALIAGLIIFIPHFIKLFR